MFRAEFSTVVSDGAPYLTLHILDEATQWRDAVRGDGRRYYPSGHEPDTLYQQAHESYERFNNRAWEALYNAATHI